MMHTTGGNSENCRYSSKQDQLNAKKRESEIVNEILKKIKKVSKVKGKRFQYFINLLGPGFTKQESLNVSESQQKNVNTKMGQAMIAQAEQEALNLQTDLSMDHHDDIRHKPVDITVDVIKNVKQLQKYHAEDLAKIFSDSGVSLEQIKNADWEDLLIPESSVPLRMYNFRKDSYLDLKMKKAQRRKAREIEKPNLEEQLLINPDFA